MGQVPGLRASIWMDDSKAEPVNLDSESSPIIERATAHLSTGLAMEWLSCRPTKQLKSASPPLLLVHGTFHGAWCWEANWMERFADAGLESHAVSLRGTSGSPCDAKSVKITEHVADLCAFAKEVLGTPPLLVGHSFGGASVLKYLEAGCPAIGAILLCSVPPSGNGPMTTRFLWRSLKQTWLITRGFAMKTAAKSIDDARALFFDDRTSDDTLLTYLPKLEADSRCGLDLRHFNANLPSAQINTENGLASWIEDAPPLLVLGAEKDAVVDREGVEETARFLNVKAEFLDGMPHDVMLCEGWETAADRIIKFSQGMCDG